jgi:hypothetical protein
MPSVVTWWPARPPPPPPPENPPRPDLAGATRSFCWDGTAVAPLPSGPALQTGQILTSTVVPERLDGPATAGVAAGVVVRALGGEHEKSGAQARSGWWLVACRCDAGEGEEGGTGQNLTTGQTLTSLVEVACLGENLQARQEGETAPSAGVHPTPCTLNPQP